MTQFHENIKTILSDVERFLENLTPSALPATAKSEKTRIANEISRLKTQYPQLQDDQGTRISEVYDDNVVEPSRSASVPEPDDTYEDTSMQPPSTPKSPAPPPGKVNRIYDEPGPGDKSVQDLKPGMKKEGHLKMRKEKKKLIGAGAKKVYCMISEEKVLYVFATNTSKKQTMALALKGYEARAITEPGNKKEFPFQLFSPGKPMTVFVAARKEEMDGWITAFNRQSGYGVRPPATPGPATEPDEENTYAEANEGRPSEIVKQVSVTTAAAAEPLLYDEANIPAAEPAREVARQPPPEPEMYYDDTEQLGSGDVEDEDGDIYEDGESIMPATADMTRGKSVMSVGYVDKPALPPRSFNDDGNKDYSQMYYGLFDCNTDEHDELPFKRGDIVEVVNRDYDSYKWWTAKLDGRMGIVPKEYLSKAYKLIR